MGHFHTGLLYHPQLKRLSSLFQHQFARIQKVVKRAERQYSDVNQTFRPVKTPTTAEENKVAAIAESEAENGAPLEIKIEKREEQGST